MIKKYMAGINWKGLSELLGIPIDEIADFPLPDRPRPQINKELVEKEAKRKIDWKATGWEDKNVEPTNLAERLTAHFAKATKKAVADLHAKGIPAHGDVDGVWQEIPPPRPSWDAIWMKMAHVIASRSIDPRTKVGAVVVSGDNTQVLAVGYNGDQKGGPNRVDSEEPGKSGCIHAEENALIKLDYSFPKSKIMYLNVSPCDMCARKIINANINEVVYDIEYRIIDGLERLKKAGVTVRQFTSVL